MYSRLASVLILVLTAPTAHAAGFSSGAYTSGGYTLNFESGGSLHLKDKDKIVLNGKWSATGDTITLTDIDGDYACAAPQQTGTYGWKAEDGGVKFTKQKDECDARIEALDGQTWKRKS